MSARSHFRVSPHRPRHTAAGRLMTEGRVGREVADHDAEVRVQGPVTRDDPGGELTADRRGAEDAGVEMKELHGEALRSVVRKSGHAALASGPGVLFP